MPERAGVEVLYLIDRLYATDGGAEGVVHKLCHFLPAHGFRCSVATFWAGDGVAQQFPCPVHIFPLKRTYDWTAIRLGFDFAHLLRSECIKIVHTFFPASDLWGGVVAKLSGCPILVSSRRDMGILRSGKHRVPYRLVNPIFHQVQAVSENVRRHCILEERLPSDKVVTVNNGINLEEVDEAPPANRNTEFGIDHDCEVVITVANPRFVKGIDLLVRAAALIRQKHPHTLFVMVGAYPFEQQYQRSVRDLIKELRVEDAIRYLGRRNDVYSLLKAADLFCLPSRSEGMSNALLEAMACRLPCVATDVGGNPEVVVDGETGFLVPTEDPEAMADRITAILRDRDLAARMGRLGRQVVEAKFTIQHMILRLASLYNDLLREHGLSTDVNVEVSSAAETKHVIGLPAD